MEEKELESVIGNSFESMTVEEMTKIQGMGEYQVDSTPGYFMESAAFSALTANITRHAMHHH